MNLEELNRTSSMMDDKSNKTPAALRLCLRQQAAVADLAQRALVGGELSALMNETVTLIASVLGVEFCLILELLPGDQDLLLRAGIGWRDGLVGNAAVDAGGQSQAGYALLSGEAVIVEDLGKDTRFAGTALLCEHGIVSGMSILIAGRNRPYGVLGVHATERRLFTQDDVHFIQSIANILSQAIERKRAEEALQESEKRYRDLTESLPQVVFETNAEGNLTFANHRAFELFGYAQEDFEKGLNVLGMLAPEDQALSLISGG